MHDLYALKDKLIEQLEEQGKKNLTDSSLKVIDTLAHAAKNVSKVIECCDDSYSGYSRHEPQMDYVRPDGSYRDGGASYRDGGASYRGRGRNAMRDSMGRYSSGSGDETVRELHKLLDATHDDYARREIEKLIDRIG